ncbi:MAG: EAL domain-containing protein [Burkholderiales bacterium]|nr:EAL domain-containing protein [Burkholderiales bacterium]
MNSNDNPALLLQSLRIQEAELTRAREVLREKERMLTTLMSNLEGMVYRCRDDEFWTMEFVSDGCRTLTGYRAEELIGNGRISYETITHPEDRLWVRAAIRGALQERRRFFVEYRIVTADGVVKWVWETGVGIYAPDDRLAAIEGFVQDVSRNKAAEHALRQAEERYRGIFENAVEGIFQTTADGQYLRANPALARIYGYDSPADLMANLSNIGGQLYVNPAQRGEFVRQMQEHGAVKNFVSEVRRRDGSVIWITENGRAVRDEDGKLLYYEGTVEDITENRRYQQRLEHQATHDALTALPNRSLLSDRLRQAVAYAKRYNQIVAVVFIDLDNFKLINDSLGHETGDNLLKAMSERMCENVRGSDTVARLSGDEFVILLRNEKAADDVTGTVHRIIRAICRPWRDQNQEIVVTCSAGISLYPRDGEDSATLLKYADAAMYRAKELGRNQIQFFTSEMNAAVRQRLDLQTRLHRALEQGEFVLHYQPKMDLATRTVIGMEALLRWLPPDEQMIGPDVFIPLAEESGFIVPLGEWVLREACRYTRQLHDAGFGRLQVAVNISARQFHQRDLTHRIRAVLEESGLEPEFLQLELTESLVMHDAEHFVATLEALDRLGVQLAVDDFGTGYSNLAYLKRFPVSRLKVDRAFVRDIISDPDDATIVKAVISLAHSLGLGVVAEGVETAEQLDFLAANNCDEIQGYLISRPVPPEQFELFLRDTLKPPLAAA